MNALGRGLVGSHAKPQQKRSRASGTSAGADKSKAQRLPRGGVRRKREDLTDDPLSSPCIVTFGGSALRVGGGYAQAELHVLETPAPEKGTGDDDDDDDDGDGRGENEAGDGGLWGGGVEGGNGREASSPGVVGFVESEDTRGYSMSKFQT